MEYRVWSIGFKIVSGGRWREGVALKGGRRPDRLLRAAAGRPRVGAWLRRALLIRRAS